MICRSPVRNAGIILLCLLLTLSFPMFAGAATLSMESFLGFNEHFLPGHWAPLTLTLENRGRDIEGSLELVVTSGSEYLQNIYQSTYSADVELPYNAKRLYAFSVKLNSFTHDLQIRLKQEGELLLERSISLRAAATEHPFVLVVDGNASPDFLSDFPSQIFPVNVRSKFLPEHSYAYQSVRMMVLNIEMLPKLREKQYQALLKWLKQGGYLILNGGMNVGAFSEPRARQLFPVRILGHRKFVGLQALEEFCGQNFRSTTPFLLLHVQSQDAKVLLREGEFPVLALREMEKGRILFSAFDYHVSAFRGWDGKREFWERLLALHDPVKDAGIPTPSALKIQKAMFANLPATIPNPKNLILLLGLYLLLLRWIFRRMQQHRGHQWGDALAFTALVLLSVSGSYLLFRANNKNVLSHNTFLRLHGSASSQLADVKYITGLYTTQETDYALFFDSTSYPIEHLMPKRSQSIIPQAYRVHQTVKGQEVRGRLGSWHSQFFQLSDTIEFPLNAKAGLSKNGLELMLRNNSEWMLQDSLLYIQQNLYTLGSLQAGEERRYSIPLKALKEKEIFNPREFLQTEQTQKEQIETSAQETQIQQYVREALRMLFGRQNAASYMFGMQKRLLPGILEAVHARYQTRPDSVCFVGWVPGTSIEMNMPQNDARGESLTLVTWEIPMQKQ